MTCSCGGCISRTVLCIGSGNDKRFLFSVFDDNNDEVDISASSEIVFSVSDGQLIAGNMNAGGIIRIEKRLSTGEVVLAGTGYQFLVNISPSDTELLMGLDNYFDATVTTSGGESYTVKAGLFRVTKTNAGV